MANNSRTKVEAPRNLSTGGKAQVVANAIIGMQEALFRIDLERDINGHDDDDIYAATGKSYAASRKKIEDAMDRMAKTHPKLMPIAKGIIDAQADDSDEE